MSNIIPLFSSFGIATSLADSRLSHHVAVKAALYEVAVRQNAAEAHAELLTERIMEQVAAGPIMRSDLRRTLALAATDDVLDSAASPMDMLGAAIQQRTEEYRTRLNGQLPGWVDTTLQPVQSPTEDAMLAAALAKRMLRPRLVERMAVLRSSIAGLQLCSASAEESLRQRTTGITKATAKPAPKKKTFMQTRKGFFIFVTLLSIAAAGAVMPLAQVPFLPVPALIVAVGVALGAFYKLDDGGDPIDSDSPFRVLRPQFITFANQTGEGEKARLQMLLTDTVLQALDHMTGSDQLPDTLQAVQSVLGQWNQMIPMHTWTGSSATQGMLTGRTLTQCLWHARKDEWTSSVFVAALYETSGAVSFEALLLAETPSAAAAAMCQAAVLAMKPITLTEAVGTLLQVVPGGRAQFLGELEGQINVLKSLLPILSHKLAANDAACPVLLHLVLPTPLATSLRPVLAHAFAAQPPQFYTSSDEEIVVIVESFNRADNERSNHAASDHALATYAKLAEDEQWSCFGPLLIPDVAGAKVSTVSTILSFDATENKHG